MYSSYQFLEGLCFHFALPLKVDNFSWNLKAWNIPPQPSLRAQIQFSDSTDSFKAVFCVESKIKSSTTVTE